MKAISIWILLFFTAATGAQTTQISGFITDNNNHSVVGANVYLEGTYEGTTTDSVGGFNFTTSKKGKYKLIAASLGYTSSYHDVELPAGNLAVNIKLEEVANELNEVVITAGTYQAGDRKRGVQLTSIDVLKTANANGDLVGALNTLPGTQNVGDDGGLFVRGGDRSEAKTFIDGLLVNNPYTSKAPDLPTRGRFSPTLFSGTLFSTGGYSAEYGQALSAALILNTNNLILNNPQSINILPFGCSAVLGQSIDSTAYSISLNYLNLKPYYKVVPQTTKWLKYPQSGSVEFISTSKLGDKTYLKIFSSAGLNNFSMELPQQVDPFGGKYYKMDNDTYYLNTLLSSRLKNVDVKSGLSFSYDKEEVDFKKATLKTQTKNLQLKEVAQWTILKNVVFRNGVECFIQQYNQHFAQPDSLIFYKPNFTNILTAVFSETESKLGKKVSVRLGLRGEYSSINDESTLAPRISAAYKVGANSQFSAAFGYFNQLPKDDLLKVNNSLSSQQAVHYIANYQYQKNGYLFRIEGYYKDYSKLSRYKELNDTNPENYSSNGYGFAKGIDIFWRDQKSIKGADYWLSFTLLDAKKKYEDYSSLMHPTYFSRYNVSAVYKQFFSQLDIQASITYQYSSGRPYLDPYGKSHYTMDLNNASVSIQYYTRVFNKFTALYLMMNNVLGIDQVYGYRYTKPVGKDVYQKSPIKAPAKSFITIGAFISLNNKF